MPHIGFEVQHGKPITIGELQVTPVTRTLVIPFPRASGGLIWNRPYRLEVTARDGQVWSLPITDVTRQGQIALLAMGLIGVVLIGLVSRNK